MASSAARPKPPAGLGKAGRDLWKAILGDLDPGSSGRIRSPGFGSRRRRPSMHGEDAPQVKALTHSELALVLAALPDEWRLFLRVPGPYRAED
jgi:hypothetical protein